MQTPERKPTTAVIFDSSLEDEIGQVLGLTMLLAYETKREIRITSLSVSRNNLKVTAFLDLMSRYFGVSPTIGMALNGPSESSVPLFMEAVLNRRTPDDKPAYPRTINRLNDTADPVALIRNALTAQPDQNSVVVLAGPSTNLLGLLALPGNKQLIEKKVRTLVIAAPFNDRQGMAKLFQEWPGPIICAGTDLGQALSFPAESIEKDFEWAAGNHPLLDTFHAAEGMLHDAPAAALAAVLYAAHPEENYFKVSEPGVLDVDENGSEVFTLHSQGKHRQMLLDPEKQARVIETYRQVVSTKPPESRRSARGPQP